MGASAAKECLRREKLTAALDVRSAYGWVYKNTHGTQSEQSENENVEFRRHAMENEYTVASPETLRVKQSCDLGSFIGQLREGESTFAAVQDIHDGGLASTGARVLFEDLRNVHAARSFAKSV